MEISETELEQEIKKLVLDDLYSKLETSVAVVEAIGKQIDETKREDLHIDYRTYNSMLAHSGLDIDKTNKAYAELVVNGVVYGSYFGEERYYPVERGWSLQK